MWQVERIENFEVVNTPTIAISFAYDHSKMLMLSIFHQLAQAIKGP